MDDTTLQSILDAPPVTPTLDDAGEVIQHQDNSLFNAIANAQNIEPGSWEWNLGGPAAFSGQSGSQESYGWNHKYKMSPAYVKQVVANYGHRRTYYTGAPYRQFGYYAGGRPQGWTPEIPGDKPDGTCSYLTSKGPVTVSGPDAEHFWLDPLWALNDSPAVSVTTPYGPMSSKVLSGVMATEMTRSIIGQIRDPSSGKPYPWGYGDRANSRILDTWLQAMKRGALEEPDRTTGFQFISSVLLPHYEASPGIGEFGNPPAGMFSVGTFNSLYWLLPVFHDATQILTAPLLKARFQAIVDRWSQWALDLEETVPGRGFDMSKFYVNRTAFVNNPKPLNTIKPLLNPNNIVFDLGWEVWSFRACSVAAKVGDSPTLKLAEQRLLQKHGGDVSKKQWIVGSDREYEIYQPVE